MNRRGIVGAVVVVVGLGVVALGVAWWLLERDNGTAVAGWGERLGLDGGGAGDLSGAGFVEGLAVTVAAEVPGQVAVVEVSEGDEVAAGDVLLRLESEVLAAQSDQATAAVDQARARRDRLAAGASAAELAGLMAAVDQAEAALDGADRVLASTSAGSGGTAVEVARQRQAAAQRDVARAALALAEARLAAARAGPAPAQLLAADAAVAAALARKAGVDAQLARLAVRSPISGTVTAAVVRSGEAVGPGTPLVTVVRQDPLDLRVYVPEADLDQVAVGQRVTVQVDGLPDDSVRGTVVAVADQPEFTPRNVQTREGRSQLVFAVTVRLPNPDGTLKPGMAGTATLEEDE
jgi:HlyD family secretion protein